MEEFETLKTALDAYHRVTSEKRMATEDEKTALREGQIVASRFVGMFNAGLTSETKKLSSAKNGQKHKENSEETREKLRAAHAARLGDSLADEEKRRKNREAQERFRQRKAAGEAPLRKRKTEASPA